MTNSCRKSIRSLAAWLPVGLFAGALALGAQTALAQDTGQVTVEDVCMQDLFGKKLGCTANDVRLSAATDVVITDPCEFPGDKATFTATFETLLTAQERHDIGIYFALDGDPNGDGALTGICSISTLHYEQDPPWLDLDGTGDTFVDTNIMSNIQDTCGDIDAGHNPLFPVITVTDTLCVDEDGDGFLDLDYCTSWRQPGSNDLCTGPLPEFDIGGAGLDSSGVIPGSPSKCKCDSIFVEVPVPPADIEVTKEATPTEVDEPGGPVIYTVSVTNTGIDPANKVTLNSLIDAPYGDITVVDGTIITATTCAVPQIICPNAPDVQCDTTGDPQAEWQTTYTCNFTANVSGNGGDEVPDTVTADGVDSNGNPVTGSAEALVTILDLQPAISVDKTADPTIVLEGSQTSVTFTVVVNNNSPADPLTITSLTDDIHGNLNGQGNCAVPQTIALDGNYTCSFTAVVDGQAFTSETDEVTAVGQDDETPANVVQASDSATVTILDNPAMIELIKTADPTSVDEPGANVTYTFTVNNRSDVDVVTINSLTDDVYGDLTAVAGSTCTVPQMLAPTTGTYTCSITVLVKGNGGESVPNVATAMGVDDDNQPVMDSDDAMVNIVNVPPAASLTKTVTQMVVTYAVKTCNDSAAESLTLNALDDSVYGDVADPDNFLIESTTCEVPTTLSPQGEVGDCYPCSFDAVTTTSPTTDKVTGTVDDDDGSLSITPESNEATVTFEPATP